MSILTGSSLVNIFLKCLLGENSFNSVFKSLNVKLSKESEHETKIKMY